MQFAQNLPFPDDAMSNQSHWNWNTGTGLRCILASNTKLQTSPNSSNTTKLVETPLQDVASWGTCVVSSFALLQVSSRARWLLASTSHSSRMTQWIQHGEKGNESLSSWKMWNESWWVTRLLAQAIYNIRLNLLKKGLSSYICYFAEVSWFSGQRSEIPKRYSIICCKVDYRLQNYTARV